MYVRIDKAAARKRILLDQTNHNCHYRLSQSLTTILQKKSDKAFLFGVLPHVLILYLTTKYEMQPLMVDKPSLLILI
jgi:hypothetical protein